MQDTIWAVQLNHYFLLSVFHTSSWSKSNCQLTQMYKVWWKSVPLSTVNSQEWPTFWKVGFIFDISSSQCVDCVVKFLHVPGLFLTPSTHSMASPLPAVLIPSEVLWEWQRLPSCSSFLLAHGWAVSALIFITLSLTQFSASCPLPHIPFLVSFPWC